MYTNSSNISNNLLTTSINLDSGIYYNPVNPNPFYSYLADCTKSYIKDTIATTAINTVVDTNELKINIKKSRIKFNFNL